MSYLATLTASLGQYLASLSDKTRLLLVLVGLLLLGGTALYKLAINLQKLSDPVPAASTDALIKPMEQLIYQTSTQATDYQKAKLGQQRQLDSLKFYYQPKPNQ